MFSRSALAFCVLALCSSGVRPLLGQSVTVTPALKKLGYDLDPRSLGRILADEVRNNSGVFKDGSDTLFPGKENDPSPLREFHGDNVQVNNPALDHIQIFEGFRPFVLTTESETSVRAFGRNVVATYNSSAGVHFIPNPSGPGLVADRLFLTGFSSSTDGGHTWKSGFMPPLPGSIFTFGDPALDIDRRGNFYFANLGADATGASTVQFNKSTDGGRTFSPAVVVQQDDGSDKDWIAVGPDPQHPQRDNVYVTWTSFQASGAQLRLGRSIDGGATWTVSIVYAPSPDPDPTHPQEFIQSTNPVVDHFTGRLYIPFLHFSNADQDFIQILFSDDGGATFQFVKFNIPGAPDATLLPITQAGHLAECGVAIQQPPTGPPVFVPNTRLTVHAGPNVGGSLTGLPRWVNATRILTQPALDARRGFLFLAWANSTSTSFGDPTSHSNILAMQSRNGGRTWSAPVAVNSHQDTQNVMPAVSISDDGQNVYALYFTQHGDESMDVNLAKSEDGGHFDVNRVTSTSVRLAPSNSPLPTVTNPFATTNYDRVIAQCYTLGEYLSVVEQSGTVYALWGDSRNLLQQPVNALDPISGQVHPVEDVFFQALGR